MERVQVSAHRHEPLLRSGQQDLKAGRREVSISRQCPGKLEFAHQDKTGAIGERVRVVGVLPKEGLRGIKSRHTDPFDANRGALLHKIQYSGRHVRSTARVRKIHRFGHHVV